MIEIKALWDDDNIGAKREHFVFPNKPTKGYDRAAQMAITGGVYIPKGMEIPDSILIKIDRK